MSDQIMNQLITPVVVGFIIAVGGIIATQIMKRRHSQHSGRGERHVR